MSLIPTEFRVATILFAMSLLLSWDNADQSTPASSRHRSFGMIGVWHRAVLSASSRKFKLHHCQTLRLFDQMLPELLYLEIIFAQMGSK
jgi:hypothetical protein